MYINTEPPKNENSIKVLSLTLHKPKPLALLSYIVKAMAIIFTTTKYIIRKYNIISPKGLLILKTKIYLSLLALSLLIAVITLNYYEVANPVKEVINTNTVPITESTTKKVIKKSQDKFFMKGIWVTYMDLDMSDTDRSYTSFKKKFDSIVDTCKEKGFNTLIVQVRPFSDALYT